jgi:hypothetical protein
VLLMTETASAKLEATAVTLCRVMVIIVVEVHPNVVEGTSTVGIDTDAIGSVVEAETAAALPLPKEKDCVTSLGLQGAWSSTF